MNYPNDIDTLLEDELHHFIEHCSSKDNEWNSSIIKLYDWFTKMNLKSIYPNIDIVFRLCLCLPVSNCSAERSFSCLKRIVSYLRSTTGQDRLEALAILNFEDIFKDFAEKSKEKSLCLKSEG